MIAMSFVPPFLEDVVGYPQEDTDVQGVYYILVSRRIQCYGMKERIN